MISIGQLNFRYPILSISVIENNIIFSTKKIASRYLEEISTNSYGVCNTINFEIFDKIDRTKPENSGLPSNPELEILKYALQVTGSSRMDCNQFFSILKINSISELFEKSFMEKYNFIFVTRDPIERFLTGFFEKIDSILGNIQLNKFGYHIYGIIKRYFEIDDFTQISVLPQYKIDKILNEFSESITHEIFDDEHTSFWNVFIFEFLTQLSILDDVKVVDIENFNLYQKTQQPTNKPWLDSWKIGNKDYYDSMMIRFDNYFKMEINAYNDLINV